MHTIINSTTDFAAAAAAAALDHARGLGSLVLCVSLLVGLHAGLHHVVAGQAAQAAALDQLAKPAAVAQMAQSRPAQQQWIPVR